MNRMPTGMAWKDISPIPGYQRKIDNYKHLWKIEKAFRIAKTDLKIRPIYHQLQRRMEAHICIAFVAYKIYKELERQLKVLQ